MTYRTAVGSVLNVCADERAVDAAKQELRIKNIGVWPEIHHALSHAEVPHVRDKARFAHRSFTGEENVSDLRSTTLYPDLVVPPIGRIRSCKMELSVPNVCRANHGILASCHHVGRSVFAVDDARANLFGTPQLPMLRNVTKPRDTGCFEGDGGV